MANQMLSMIGAFAKFESSLIHERQPESIPLARLRGAWCGRNNYCPQNNKFKFYSEHQRVRKSSARLFTSLVLAMKRFISI